MVRGKRFALMGYLGRMREGFVGGHRTGVRGYGGGVGGGGGDELRPVHQYCHKGTNCAGIQSQS